MSIQRIIGVVLAAGGAILLWKGWESYNSVGSKFGRALSGGSSNETLLMLAGGAVLVAAGVFLAVRR